jgi:flagellar biosynthetic protein FliQ
MITQTEITAIMQDAIYTVIITAAPMLLAALLVGLAVSIFQATTQINEQTLAFVPKILAILLAILIFGGWMINHLTDFTTRLYESILIYLR